MAQTKSLRTLFAGILSPVVAFLAGPFVYRTLTSASSDRDADYVFRLSMTAAAMAVPFVVTSLIALSERKRGPLGVAGAIGLVLATASLLMTFAFPASPLNALARRARQAENLARSGEKAPMFETVDIEGQPHRLADHAGKVVLVNLWATWCTPCRREMPDLDRLYQARKDEGFMIFGISDEDVPTQKKFAEEITVSYPLLTLQGEVPEIFRQTARYPANFLIDREGNLQPAPSVDLPFERLEEAVDALLAKTGTSD